MENIQQMRKRHDREEEHLRGNCPHTKLSKWLDQYWAIAHGTGFQVKTCVACGKVVRKRTGCRICGQITEEYKDGLGTHSRPYGSHYCPNCFKRSEKEVREDGEQKANMDKYLATHTLKKVI